MHSPDSHDSLSRALADWRVAPRRDPQFRARVWERISAAVRPLPWRSYARQHAAALAGVLAVAIVAGALTGRERAHARAAADSAQLAALYVQTYDARAMHR
jgi:hypothetical protein